MTMYEDNCIGQLPAKAPMQR